MTYTAVFQNAKGEYSFMTVIETHDRTQAWESAHEKRTDLDSCLVLLIDGDAIVRTYADVVDLA